MNRTEKPSQESRRERQNTRELIGRVIISYMYKSSIYGVFTFIWNYDKGFKNSHKKRIMVDY